MKMTSMRVGSFKSLIDPADIEIRPLTFLVGPNSSGKSSVIQLLLALKQTAENRDTTNPLLTNGPYVSLGAYSDFISRHDKTQTLFFEVRFVTEPADERRLYRPWGPDEAASFEPSAVVVTAELGYNQRLRQIYLQSSAISRRRAEESLSVSIQRRTRTVRGTRYKMILEAPDVGPVAVDGVEPYKFCGPERPKYLARRARPATRIGRRIRDMSYALMDLAFAIEQTVKGIYYIGPLREWPQRYYVVTGASPEDVGLRGADAAAVLWLESRKGRRRRTELLGKVNMWLSRFGIAHRLQLSPIGGNLYNVMLTDPQTKVEVNVADVGFGASQILPVIVEVFYAPPGSMLLVEQPEIHLHPSAQADLGDLFVEAARERGHSILVETHSEHLLSRVRTRIAEHRIDPGQVAVYYFERTRAGTRISEIQLNELGQFERWPPGFFEEGFQEALDHFRAVAEHQARRSGNA